jgi:hypothetical protein
MTPVVTGSATPAIPALGAGMLADGESLLAELPRAAILLEVR